MGRCFSCQIISKVIRAYLSNWSIKMALTLHPSSFGNGCNTHTVFWILKCSGSLDSWCSCLHCICLESLWLSKTRSLYVATQMIYNYRQKVNLYNTWEDVHFKCNIMFKVKCQWEFSKTNALPPDFYLDRIFSVLSLPFTVRIVLGMSDSKDSWQLQGLHSYNCTGLWWGKV